MRHTLATRVAECKAVVFSLGGRISKVYLADALVEAAFVAGWLASE
jgi:hypothetical protein